VHYAGRNIKILLPPHSTGTRETTPAGTVPGIVVSLIDPEKSLWFYLLIQAGVSGNRFFL
jgi:hypothetical protein